MNKSYVGMGFNACPVCGIKHSEAVLIHKRMKEVLTKVEFLGWAMCPEHQKLKDEDYIALVEVTNQPKNLADADRTGNIAHVRSSAWPNIFNAPLPDQGLAFVEVGTIAKLQEKTQ